MVVSDVVVVDEFGSGCYIHLEVVGDEEYVAGQRGNEEQKKMKQLSGARVV